MQIEPVPRILPPSSSLEDRAELIQILLAHGLWASDGMSQGHLATFFSTLARGTQGEHLIKGAGEHIALTKLF